VTSSSTTGVVAENAVTSAAMSIDEDGKSGVNQMQFTALLKHRSAPGQPWKTVSTKTAATKYFANTSASKWTTWGPRWDYRNDDSGQDRIDVSVNFLDLDPPGTGVIDTHSVVGRPC
jgi:hypothetical protein